MYSLTVSGFPLWLHAKTCQHMLGLRIFLQHVSHILFLATEVMVRGTFSLSPNVSMWEPLLPGVNGFEVTCLAFLFAHPSLLT